MKDTKQTPKTNRMTLRLDDIEHDKLKRVAEAWGVSLSVAVRRLIRQSKVGNR